MKKTLSIGIAAYNEEANIASLINALLKQKIESAELKEILVVSDASSDDTDKIVMSFGKQVAFFRHEERMGANAVQNTISSKVTGDILLMLDADILPQDTNTVEKMIRTMSDNNADLVSAHIVPLAGKNIFEKTLVWSHEKKVSLFERFHMSSNIFLAFGPARLLSRKLYTEMKYPENCPTDSYSYLYTVSKKFTFSYAKEAVFAFRSPNNFADYTKQANRYTQGNVALQTFFNKDLIEKEFHIPKNLLVGFILKSALTSPLMTLGYTCIITSARMSNKTNMFSSTWDIASSSKKL